MDMGETLRRAREERGLSLDALSRRTKISAALLRAIEGNDLDRLPGGIFLRGFLRAYAREVGVDADDIVTRYLAQFESHAPNEDEGTVTRPTAERFEHLVQDRWIERSVREMSSLGLAAIVVLAVLLAYVALRQPETTSRSGVASTDVPVTGASTSSGERAASAVEPAPSGPGAENVGGRLPDPVATSGQKVQAVNLTIETVGPCWVSVIVDGRTVVYRLMQAGERQVIEGGTEVLLRVGDPSTFTYMINGVAGRSLGPAGVPTTVHVTTLNYPDFTVTR